MNDTEELERLRAMERHMNLCRKELNVPEDEVLLEAIKYQAGEIERLKKLLRDLPKSFGITKEEIDCKDYRTSTARERERRGK